MITKIGDYDGIQMEQKQNGYPTHSLDYFKKKPCVAGINFCNKVPQEILFVNYSNSFKKH